MGIDSVSASKICKRLDETREWLADEAPYIASDQRHLDANTPERVYWHFGYAAALADVLKLAGDRVSRNSGNVDKTI